nr:uncharacterized protein LOC123755117 [Procambarus clarkii]
MGARGRPEVDPWGFVFPLSPLVWAAILTTLLMLPGIVFVLSSCCFPYTGIWRKWCTNYFRFTLVLLQQEVSVGDDWWWERIVMLVWMMVTLVLTQSYAGNLMALLSHLSQEQVQSSADTLYITNVTLDTAKNRLFWLKTALTKVGNLMVRTPTMFRLVVPHGLGASRDGMDNWHKDIELMLISHHHELSKHNKELVILKRPNAVTPSMTAKSGIFREVGDLEKVGRLIYLPLRDFPRSVDSLVRSGRHLLVDADINFRSLMAQDVSRTGRCDFYLSREKFLGFPLVMIVNKYSPLARVLFKRAMEFTETGLLDFWLRSAFGNSTTCIYSPKSMTITSSLSLNNLWGMFVILGTGLIGSFTVFCVERLSA